MKLPVEVGQVPERLATGVPVVPRRFLRLACQGGGGSHSPFRSTGQDAGHLLATTLYLY